MTESQKTKVGRFLQDTELTKLLYDILMASFLKKPMSTDVQTLAAERIAIELFREGWREVESYHLHNMGEGIDKVNMGL